MLCNKAVKVLREEILTVFIARKKNFLNNKLLEQRGEKLMTTENWHL